MTRRANQGHLAIIARTIESPRGAIRGGLFVCHHFPPSDGGRTSRRHISPHLSLRVGSEPPSELERTTLLAGARERAGPAARRLPPPHAAPPVERYGSRRKDRARAICRHFLLSRSRPWPPISSRSRSPAAKLHPRSLLGQGGATAANERTMRSR